MSRSLPAADDARLRRASALPPRLVRRPAAASYVTAPQLFDDLESAGWIKPTVGRHGMTLFDLNDLDACIERLKDGEYPEESAGAVAATPRAPLSAPPLLAPASPPAAPIKTPQSCYTIKEACAYLRLSENSVRRLMGRGLLKYSKALRTVKLLGDSVETLWQRTS